MEGLKFGDLQYIAGLATLSSTITAQILGIKEGMSARSLPLLGKNENVVIFPSFIFFVTGSSDEKRSRF